MRKIFFCLLPLCGCLNGVFINGKERELMSRAAFDLSCPSQQILIHKLDTYTRGVTGCEKKATYVFDMKTDAWMMNSNR